MARSVQSDPQQRPTASISAASPNDVQVSVLLTGKGRSWQVLGGGAGADRDRPGSQCGISVGDFCAQVGGHRNPLDVCSNGGPFTAGGSLRNVEIERLDDRRVRVRGDNEAVGHREASPHQLSEVGCLAPGGGEVVLIKIT